MRSLAATQQQYRPDHKLRAVYGVRGSYADTFRNEFGIPVLIGGYGMGFTGIALAVGGLMLGVYGFTQIFGTQESKSSVFSFLGSVPARIFGVVFLLIGLAMVLLGGFEILSPDGFDQFIERVRTGSLSVPK